MALIFQAPPPNSIAPSALQSRRLQVTETIEWKRRKIQVGYGFDEAMRLKEVFLAGNKDGDIADILTDAAILISKTLQAGVSTAEIAEWLAREGTDPAEPHASPVGLIAARLPVIESEMSTCIPPQGDRDGEEAKG